MRINGAFLGTAIIFSIWFGVDILHPHPDILNSFFFTMFHAIAAIILYTVAFPWGD